MEKKKKKYNLTIGVVLGAVLGLVVGLILKEKSDNLAVFGNLFMRLIQMPLIALVMCSVMEAVGGLKPAELGKLGSLTIALFAVTSAVGGLFGVILGFVFKPGIGLDMSIFAVDTSYVAPDNGGVIDTIMGYFSNNIFGSMSSGNNLQCVIAAIFLGVALSIYGSKHEKNPVLDGIRAINKIVMQYISIVIQILPLAIFSFVAQAVGVLGNQLFKALGLLVTADFVGMIGMTIIFGVLTAIFCGVNPLKIFRKLGQTAMVAAVSASSAVTLPTKVEDTQTKLGVSPRIAKFVCPMGMSMNCDGALMFFTLSCITVAQAFGITQTTGDLIHMVLFSTAFSFAVITVPGGGLVMLAIILQACGLPAAGMVIISAADFILGPIRTVNNNIDDMMVAMVVAKVDGEFSKEIYDGTKEFDPSVESYK